MYEIKENISLKKFNTFGIDVKTRFFVECDSVESIIKFLNLYQTQNLPLMILGGGSNILFTRDFNGYVVHPVIKGIEVVYESDTEVGVRVGAGEDWDDFVNYCVNKGWGGVENLSLIPGNIGTCPIQNIGAYGVEVKDVITRVETIELQTKNKRIFTNNECRFGYRDSIFKREFKGQYLITHVNFMLKKQPVFNLEYGNLKEKLKELKRIDLQSIRKAIVDIRESKLPDPDDLGNAGSFFKNPVVKVEITNKIKSEYSDVPVYPVSDGFVKVPAGWLIEKAGFKGKRIGDAGVHSKQALVLVNYGNATGAEIISLAKDIQQTVVKLFGIELEMEVNIV